MNKQGLPVPKLLKRDERFRIAMDVSQVAVWDWDVESNSVFFSQQWKRMRGISGSEGYGCPDGLFDSVHPEEKFEREARKTQWLEGQQDQFHSEYQVEHKSGSWVRISERVKVFRDNAGNVCRIVGAETEILRTHPSKSSTTIEETGSAIRADDLPLGLLRFRDGKCVYANKFWSQYTGRSVKSALGDGYLDAVHPEDRPKLVGGQVEAQNGPLLENLVVNEIEVRHLLADGTVRWFLTQVCVRYSDQGTAADKTITMIDITDRKELEQKQERLTAILESTSDFICIASVDCKMLWCNQRFTKLRPDLDPADGVDCMEKYSPSSQKIVRDIAIPAAIENGIWSGEITILDFMGEDVPVSLVLSAHKSEDGSVENFSAIMRDVSDLKKASNALHASENKFASLVAALPVAVFELDADGENCVHLNERWSELSGSPKKSGLRIDFQDTIHPEDLPGLQENLLASEDSFETRHLMPDGSTKWILRQMVRMFDADGSVKGYLGTLTDTSKLKEAVESLRATKDRLQLAIEGTAAGIFEFHPSDGTLIWDERTMKIHGVSPDEFTGTSEDFYQLLSPADLERHKEEYEQLLEVGHFTSEFQIRRPDGKRRYVLADQLVLRNDQNEIEKIIGLCIDVTQQRKTQLALHETQTQLRVMTDNIHAMLYRYVQYPDGTNEFPFVSPGAREIYEVEPENAMNDSSSIFQRLHPDDSAYIENAILESFQNLSPFKVEYRINLPEKGLRWVQAMSNPTLRDDGAVVWDGFVIDVTERKEGEIELQKARMKDEFLANVSHELRTPLNAMLGMTEGLQEGVFGPMTVKQLESLKVIEHSGDHLLGLINEMLDLAKVESGQVELVLSSVEVSELWESSLRFVAQQAEHKNIRLNLDLPFNIPKVSLDEQRIRQVLINLLSNAVKFTPDGGAVSVKVQRLPPVEKYAEGILRTTITDTGIGVENAKLDSLFVPFVQVDSSLSRNYEGTGLGLALVKQYVELHGGEVAVTSELGIGSCFEFTLPYRRAISSSPEKPKLPDETRDSSNAENLSDNPVPSPLVLLAEDNEDIALATSCFLKASGYRVLHATNGSEAVDIAVEHSPNLILMDIQMPGVDGLEAMRQLRIIPEHHETPIVAVTGLARQFDNERCLEAGANEYLSKPYKMAELVNTIQKLLEKRSSVDSQ